MLQTDGGNNTDITTAMNLGLADSAILSFNTIIYQLSVELSVEQNYTFGY